MQSRDQLRDRLCEAVGGMLDGADEFFSGLAEKATEDEVQKRYLGARDLAVSNREAVESQLRQRYGAEFQKRTNKARKIATSLSEFSLDDLALGREDDFAQTLRFNDL